jgi:hypothetical protein
MRIVAAILAGVATVSVAVAAEVGGVKLDDKVRVAPGGPELVLNGAGIRTRFFVKVYVGALYLPEKKTAAADVLALPGAKRMHLAMLRELTAQQLADAVNEGFVANNPPADQERYKSQLAELLATMNALGAAKNGEAIALDFVPDSGTRVLVNGAAKGKPIPDEGFYRAILKIWLGDKPVDADLKRGLLGQG